jgi:hypothetical protein
MDDARFDALIRSFGAAHSRREFSLRIGGVIAGGLLTALGATGAAAGGRPGGAPCKRGRQCRTHKCVGPKGNKHCTCSQKFPGCRQPGNPCQEATCDTVSQRCGTTNSPDDDPCGGTLTCSGGVCAQDPGCAGAASPCPTPPQSCCGQCFAGIPTSCICSSGKGRPCQDGADCCDAACIGFYCGGCRGEGQPCNTPGVSCCGQFLCQGGVCQDPTPGV